MAWRIGALALLAYKLRKLNGPNFTWPMMMFASALPEPLNIKTRLELLETIWPEHRHHLRADTGDMPEGFLPLVKKASAGILPAQ